MPKAMHCQEELVKDLQNEDQLSALFRMSMDGYSTSKHLLVLASVPIGLNAKVIGEIGVGRSSVALWFAAKTLGARFVSCDRYDYRGLLGFGGKHRFIVGDADKFYSKVKRVDFMFLDYLSTRKLSAYDCYREIKRAYKIVPQNGMVAVHDVCCGKYNVAKALTLFKRKFNAEVIVFPYSNGMALIRRTAKSRHGKLRDSWPKKRERK